MTYLATARTLSERIADYVYSVEFADIPGEVVDKAKHVIAYDLGQALLGLPTEEARRAVALAETLSGGAGSATVIGSPRTVQPLDAAFANCTMMRAPLMDDVLFPVGVHAGLVTLPVGLALAEVQHLSGEDLLVALVAGYDVIGVLGAGIFAWDSATPRRPTIPFGPFGGAVVAARLLRLDPATIGNALGYAAHSAMGLAQDPWTHYYSLVARNGMMCAFLAQAGGETSPAILECDNGFYRTFFGDVPETIEVSIGGLGKDFAILGATTKRYPGTGLNIVAIELVRTLVREHQIHADDVRCVDVVLPATRENFGESVDKGPFANAHKAASSLPFQISMVLLDGTTDHARYAEYDSPAIAALVRRIEVDFDPHLAQDQARVTISRADGTAHTDAGEQRPFPDLDPLTALSLGSDHGLPRADVERVAHLVTHLESVTDVGELMRALRPTA